MSYIATPSKKYNREFKRTKHGNHITVKTPQDIARDNWKLAKSDHKQAIKQLRRDIRNHRLLRRIAKAQYKLSK